MVGAAPGRRTADIKTAADAISTRGTVKARTYRDRLVVVYSVKDPAKLVEVDSLLARRVGQEHDLYLRVCAKYQVTPDIVQHTGAT